jgi:hypothetical protein
VVFDVADQTEMLDEEEGYSRHRDEDAAEQDDEPDQQPSALCPCG